jgi:hypothetical protein
MRQSRVYVMRDQMRGRVSAIMQEDRDWQDGAALGSWIPGMLLGGLLLANLFLAGMPG